MRDWNWINGVSCRHLIHCYSDKIVYCAYSCRFIIYTDWYWHHLRYHIFRRVSRHWYWRRSNSICLGFSKYLIHYRHHDRSKHTRQRFVWLHGHTHHSSSREHSPWWKRRKRRSYTSFHSGNSRPLRSTSDYNCSNTLGWYLNLQKRSCRRRDYLCTILRSDPSKRWTLRFDLRCCNW